MYGCFGLGTDDEKKKVLTISRGALALVRELVSEEYPFLRVVFYEEETGLSSATVRVSGDERLVTKTVTIKESFGFMPVNSKMDDDHEVRVGGMTVLVREKVIVRVGKIRVTKVRGKDLLRWESERNPED